MTPTNEPRREERICQRCGLSEEYVNTSFGPDCARGLPHDFSITSAPYEKQGWAEDFDESVEKYIRDTFFKEDGSPKGFKDPILTYIIGNIRGFASHIKKRFRQPS